MTSRELLALAVARRAGARRGARSRSRRGGSSRASRVVGALADRRARRSRSPSSRSRDPASRSSGDWIVVDAAGGLLVGVIGVVGLASVLVSPALPRDARTARSSRAERARARRTSSSLFAFWAVLLAVPLAGQPRRRLAARRGDDRGVGAARRLQRQARARSRPAGSTSSSPRSGSASRCSGSCCSRPAVPAAGSARSRGARSRRYAGEHETALVAYLLLLAGLAAKIGWAPVHNWLPDAHSEAPPPVSALLSAALLPAVLLVAWRSEQALAPVDRRADGAGGVLVGFGLVSLAVAVPFLWRPLAWKRLLAYSSLEHMGVIALGIGFGDAARARRRRRPHRRRTRVAKALGFYAATPLLGHEPRAAGHAVDGHRPHAARARRRRSGISLGALAGLPPSPLFVSEVLIVAGGFQAGRAWAAAAAAVLLALGFLGLAHALHRDDRRQGRAARDAAPRPGLRGVDGAHRRRRSRCCSRSPPPRSGCPARDLVDALVEGDLVSSSRAYRERSRRRSPTAGASPASTRPPTAPSCARCSSRPTATTRLETVDARGRRGAVDRRPRPGRRLGRARGARPLRHRASTATSRCGRSSTTTSTSTAGPCRCAATTPTRSRSGRSTPA